MVMKGLEIVKIAYRGGVASDDIENTFSILFVLVSVCDTTSWCGVGGTAELQCSAFVLTTEHVFTRASVFINE